MSLSLSTTAQGQVSQRQESLGLGGGAQVARLFRLILVLQSERFPNARELGEICDVSRRTVHRDLGWLADAGVPVRYDQKRQGYQLAKGFFLPPLNLDEAEALALLVLARQWGGVNMLGLSEHASSGALKLVQGLSPEVRDRVLGVVEPLQIDRRPDPPPAHRREMYEAILSALARRYQIRVWYRDRETAARKSTKFSIYRLIWQDRHWVMVGRSTLHRRVEVIGVPWIQKVEPTLDQYSIPPRFNLERFLARGEGAGRALAPQEVRLGVSKQYVSELIDSPLRPGERRVELPDGQVEVTLIVDEVEKVVRWVLGSCGQVVVLSPPLLCGRIHELATRIARMHQTES
jgi:predicted DNA-binding transcriptional regulator YafY